MLIKWDNNSFCLWLVKDIPTNGLYCTFNSKNNENAVAFKTTIDKLKELDYEFPYYINSNI